MSMKYWRIQITSSIAGDRLNIGKNRHQITLRNFSSTKLGPLDTSKEGIKLSISSSLCSYSCFRKRAWLLQSLPGGSPRKASGQGAGAVAFPGQAASPFPGNPAAGPWKAALGGASLNPPGLWGLAGDRIVLTPDTYRIILEFHLHRFPR